MNKEESKLLRFTNFKRLDHDLIVVTFKDTEPIPTKKVGIFNYPMSPSVFRFNFGAETNEHILFNKGVGVYTDCNIEDVLKDIESTEGREKIINLWNNLPAPTWRVSVIENSIVISIMHEDGEALYTEIKKRRQDQSCNTCGTLIFVKNNERIEVDCTSDMVTFLSIKDQDCDPTPDARKFLKYNPNDTRVMNIDNTRHLNQELKTK